MVIYAYTTPAGPPTAPGDPGERGPGPACLASTIDYASRGYHEMTFGSHVGITWMSHEYHVDIFRLVLRTVWFLTLDL
jgi:hypothetical protein